MEYVAAMVEKTLKKFKADSGEKIPLMPLFKNEEDEEFVKDTFQESSTEFRKNVLNLSTGIQQTGRSNGLL
ncbi:MAG: hypothetical protein MZV63_16520 [Marinilabiliales bacterium]|nr:hypothetical protein [Marinilabiliales bacterium]